MDSGKKEPLAALFRSAPKAQPVAYRIRDYSPK